MEVPTFARAWVQTCVGCVLTFASTWVWARMGVMAVSVVTFMIYMLPFTPSIPIYKAHLLWTQTKEHLNYSTLAGMHVPRTLNACGGFWLVCMSNMQTLLPCWTVRERRHLIHPCMRMELRELAPCINRHRRKVVAPCILVWREYFFCRF